MVKEKNEIGIKSIYNLNEISKPKALILGFQHMFAMFGATVLVPILTGLSVQTTLLMAGLGTLLFHLITGGKVPAFLGSSFAFIAGYHAIAGAPGSEGFNAENLPYACGGVFVAGLVYVVVAGLIKLIGIKRVMRFFPPVVTGPIIICIGLILAPVAISSITREITRADGTAVPSGVNWVIALAAILTIIICNIWARGMLKIIPILLGIIVGYVVALLFGVVNFSGLSGLSVVGLPIAKENLMKFNASAIITMVPISLATMMEHVGDISAISATVGKNYIASPGLHRSLIGDGLATSFASIFGGPANTTYGENTGVLVLTRVYAPRVMQIAAILAIIASFFPHIGAFILSIPGVVIGGVSLILYGMISAIGVRNMVENSVDLTKSRNLIVAALILVTGLGFNAVGGLNFNIGQAHISLSGLAVAALVGIIMNAILPGKDYEFSMEGAAEGINGAPGEVEEDAEV